MAEHEGPGGAPDSDALGHAPTVAPPSSEPPTGLQAPPISGLEETMAPAASTARGLAARGALRTVAAEDYELGEEIARGGMGRIRRANDLRLGRPVAVKELLATEPEMVVRFLREIRLTARLQHPSIVSVYEAGTWPSGEMFFAMRIVPGKSLDQVVAPLKALAERLALVPNVIAIVEALAYAHDNQIIHRDLKPGNVLIGPFGETVVIDWGLGKDLAAADDSLPPRREDDVVTSRVDERASEGASHLTMAGSVMGTPAYMPPEQAVGDQVDERADVYSLGAILYHVLAGRAPFIARRADDLLVKVLSKKPAALLGIDRDIPPDLVAIVEKAMAREATHRYASARELAADLRRFHTGQLVGAHSYSWWALVRRWVRKHLAAVVVGAAAVVALAVTASLLVRNIVRERDRAAAASVRALAARDQAEIAAARLHFDQARQELLAGNPLRAAALGRAALAGDDTPAVRLVVGGALQTLDPLIRRFEGVAEPIVSSGLLPDGAHIFAVTLLGKVRVWNVATGALTAGFERAGKVIGASVSPDGTMFVLVGEESEIELWDRATGTLARTITVEGGAVEHAQLSPDGTRLVLAGDGISVWDPRTGAKTAEVDVEIDVVNVLRYTADGGTLVVADNTGGVVTVDTKTWRPRMRTNVGPFAVTDCSLSPDGARLACVWRDGGVIVDARTAAKRGEIDAPGQGRADVYRGVEWSADGATLAISTAGANARLVESVTGHTRALFPSASVAGIAPDDQLITFGPTAGHIALWNGSGQRLVDELAGHGRPISFATFSPDAKTLVTTSDDGTVSAWRVSANPSITRAPLAQPARAALFVGPLLVTGGVDGTAEVYDAAGVRTRSLGVKVEGGFDPLLERQADGTLLVALGPGKILQLVEPATGVVRKTFTVPQAIARIGASAAGHRVWAATATSLHVWDAATGTELGTFPFGELEADPIELVGAHARAAVTSDGVYALVPADKGLAIIELATKKIARTLPITEALFSVTAHASTAVVLTTGGAALYDIATGARIASVIAQGEVVQDLRFAGDALYTQGSDRVIRRWDATTGALLATFDAEPDGALLFAVQPGGALLATYADDRIGVWDTRTGKRLLERMASSPANSTTSALAFSANDQVVATSIAGERWTWTLPTWRDTLAALDARLACDVPWRLVDGTLAPRSLPAVCPKSSGSSR